MNEPFVTTPSDMPDESSKEHDKEAETVASPSSSSQPSVSRIVTAKDLPEGTVIDGKYRIQSLLGQGGMGVVMAAQHVHLKERVALKFLRVDDDGADTAFRSRFRREAQICAKVKNDHITRVIDVGTFKDAEYMVMELHEGSDLRGLMRARGPLDPAEAVDLGVQICDGLAAVHAQGIVHRDLKPSNLFVVRRGDGAPLVKILDFGISKWATDLEASEDELTKTGAVLGSPKYMAPEQLFGSNTVDARADVWSVGAIVYELLTGKAPFEEPTFARLCARLASGEPPRRARELRPELSEELDAAVMLCLERNLADRIPNVAQLAGELLAAIGDPTADAVRERCLAMLAGGSSSDEHAAVSMRSGEFVKASLSLGKTGSTPSVRSVTPTGATPLASPAAPEPEPKRSRAGLYVALVAAAGLAIFFAMRAGPPPPPPTAGAAAQPSVAAAPPTVTVTVTVTASATEKPAAPVGSDAPVPSAPPTTAPIKFVGKKVVLVPAATTTQASAPPPPPPPVATATATATVKKANPLEERN